MSMENNKPNLIVIARTAEEEDMAFYKTLLRQDSPLFNKAIVFMFSKGSQFLDFISSMSSDFSFHLLIHLGKRTKTKGQDGEEIINEIKNELKIENLMFEFTSREGENTLNGKKVHHTQKLADNFDITTIPINNVGKLLKR